MFSEASLGNFKKRHKRGILPLFFLLITLVSSSSYAGVLVGKVTSIHGDLIELDLGSDKGVRSGDSGRVYYTIKVAAKEKPIYIAKFKITHLSEKSSMAQIEDRTGEIQVGYSVEVVLKEGVWLEVKSDPSGAKVYLDGKESGDTPMTLSDIKIGRHQIRVAKEGYEAYEVSVETGLGRKEVFANLKKKVKDGELMVRTEPSGASVYVNERPVGTSPYDTKNLPPGKYGIRVTKEGYEAWEKVETIEAGKKVEVLAQLRIKVGHLVVMAKPSGAHIYIDGKLTGTNDYEDKALSPRSYRVRVAKEGYETWEGDVEVKAGERVEASVELKVEKGELIVRTEPVGGTIYLNGKLVGKSPYEGKELSPGSYKMRISKEGFQTWEGIVKVERGKKAEVVAKLKEIDWGRGVYEAPVWNIGDKWIYRTAKGDLSTREVLDVKKDLFILKTGEAQDLRAYDKKSMNIKFLIEKSGKQIPSTGSFKKVLDFPMFVGKRWKDTVAGTASISKREVTFDNDFEIQGIEEVTTAAGTFKAFKIYHKQTFATTTVNSGWIRYWYAPPIKNIIKIETDKSSYWRGVIWLQDIELTSYELK